MKISDLIIDILEEAEFYYKNNCQLNNSDDGVWNIPISYNWNTHYFEVCLEIPYHDKPMCFLHCKEPTLLAALQELNHRVCAHEKLNF